MYFLTQGNKRVPAPGPLCILGMALACAHFGIHAQTAGRAHASLPTVVVSSGQNNLLAEDLPLTADVIEGDKLGEQQTHTLRQALQDLPNVAVRSTPARVGVGAAGNAFARDGNMGINIRGLGGNRVLMTVDGIRMPRSYVSRSAMFDREYLSLELFKRVELIRGPAAAQYGGDGMAGVVNFITHDPQDFLKAEEGAAPRAVGGRVALGWSQDDRGFVETGSVAGRASDRLQWMLTATARQSHALDNMGSNAADDNRRTRPDPTDNRDAAVLGKIVWKPEARQRHVFTLEHTQKDSEVQMLSSRGLDGRTGNTILGEDTDLTVQRTRVAWDARFGVTSDWADHLRTVVSAQKASSHRLGNSHVQRVTPTPGPVVHRVRDNRYDERTWQLGLQADKVLRSGDWAHRLVYGLDYVRSRITNLYDGQGVVDPAETFPLKRFPDTRETMAGLYLQDETVVGDWTITPGLRIDHFSIDATGQTPLFPQPARSLSGQAVLPKLGVLYRATPVWSVFGQYATGYRAPEPGQLNDRFQLKVGPLNNVVIPNPDLRPERSRGLELGLRGRMERLNLDLVAFDTRYSNLIEDARLIGQTYTGALLTQNTFQTVNIARARIYGLEFKGGYDWGSVGEGRLRTTLAYGLTRGTDRTSGRPLNSVTPAQLSLGLRYDTAPWSLYADLRHYAAKREGDIDRDSIGNYDNGKKIVQFAPSAVTTLDLGAQWRITRGVRLNVALNNLTDRKYWMWPDVYGKAVTDPVLDAYTQPGRNARVSLVVDF